MTKQDFLDFLRTHKACAVNNSALRYTMYGLMSKDGYIFYSALIYINERDVVVINIDKGFSTIYMTEQATGRKCYKKAARGILETLNSLGWNHNNIIV